MSAERLTTDFILAPSIRVGFGQHNRPHYKLGFLGKSTLDRENQHSD